MFDNKDSKISPHQNVHFPTEITKQGGKSLQMQMKNAELYSKVATVMYGLQSLAARSPELASKLERLDCSHCTHSEYMREYQSN